MHVLLRDYNVGKHAEFLVRCEHRRQSMVRRFQERIDNDPPTYREAESLLLSYNRFQHPAAKRREDEIRCRLRNLWLDWAAAGHVPTAKEIVTRPLEGSLTWTL
jgi:hypothetical protein